MASRGAFSAYAAQRQRSGGDSASEDIHAAGNDVGPCTDGSLPAADAKAASADPVCDPRGSELMPYDDGSLSAKKGQSSAMSLVVNFTDPTFAAGATFFGLGLLVLPMLARLGARRKADGADIASAFSYDAITQEPGNKVFSSAELRKRFGVLDVSTMLSEITMSTNELDDHMNECGASVAEDETSKIQKWRDRVNGNLKALQKRSALAFLGLHPDASESDINKTYKKMALELHPDKGGDAQKFQELQEMKERLNEAAADEEGTTRHEEDDDAEEAKARKEAREKEEKEENKLPADERLKKLRMDAHDNAVRLWERARKSRDVIAGEKAVKSNAQPALNLLRSFIDRFVKSEVNGLRHDDGRGAEAKLRKFVQQGAEILAVAAVADVQTTLQTVAMSFNYRIVARSGSAEVKRLCGVLLESIAEVPAQAELFLRQAEEAMSGSKEREKQPKEEATTKRETGGSTETGSSGANGTAGAAKASSARAPAASAASAASAPSAAKPAQSEARSSETVGASDPFADFDFSPRGREPKQAPSALAKKSVGSTLNVAQAPRTGWDPDFDHPYAGALRSNGTGIFCRPCQRWISTYEYNVEVFYTHVDRAHPTAPPG